MVQPEWGDDTWIQVGLRGLYPYYLATKMVSEYSGYNGTPGAPDFINHILSRQQTSGGPEMMRVNRDILEANSATRTVGYILTSPV
jgi:hypothetical protein